MYQYFCSPDVEQKKKQKKYMAMLCRRSWYGNTPTPLPDVAIFHL